MSENVKRISKIIVHSIIIIVVGVIVGFCLLLIVYKLPVSMMEKRVNNSTEMLMEEFDSDVILNRYQGTYMGTFTDNLMLQTAIYEKGAHSVVDRALNVYRKEVSDKEWMPGVSLINYLNDRSGEEVSYPRYWHGYLVLLKPALLIFDMAELRLFNMIFLSLLIFGIVYILQKRKKAYYNIAFLGAIFSMYPMAIYMSLSQSICVYIMLIAMLIYLQFYKKLNENDKEIYFFLILGMLTSYFDLLTYPLLPLGACLILYIILEDSKIIQGLKYIIITSIAFGFGYLMMWVGKWIVSWIFGVKTIWSDAFETIEKRCGGVENLSSLQVKIETIKRNIEMIINKPMILFLLMIIVVAAVLIKKKGFESLEKIFNKLTLCFVISLYPIFWYLFATNHSYIHYMFTFRELFISVFAVFVGLLSLSKRNRGIYG